MANTVLSGVRLQNDGLLDSHHYLALVLIPSFSSILSVDM